MATLLHPDFGVVVRMLGALWENQRAMRPTQLQQAAKMNYTQFPRYLELLVERGFVLVRTDPDGSRWIEITPRGFEAYQFLMKGIHDLLAPKGRY
jgi:predicted transcriptional regulator